MAAFVVPSVSATAARASDTVSASSGEPHSPPAAMRTRTRQAAAVSRAGGDELFNQGLRAVDPVSHPVARWSPAAALERAAAVAVVAPVPSSLTPAERHVFRPEHAVCEASVELALTKIYAQLFGDRLPRATLIDSRVSGVKASRKKPTNAVSGDSSPKTFVGSAHDEGLLQAETMFRAGLIPVRAFVSLVVKSETYRDLFFSRCPQIRFIELNFKHILGRAPASQEEVARHVLIYSESGYEAEMDSYTDSDEYTRVFGDDVIPHMQLGNITSQLSLTPNAFNRTVKIMGSVDAGTSPVLGLPGAQVQTETAELPKFFKVSYTANSKSPEPNTIAVPFLSLNRKVSLILRCGGEVLSVDPILDC